MTTRTQTQFFLRRNGFECEDPVVVKMISLAAQKFLTVRPQPAWRRALTRFFFFVQELAKESYTFSKQRMSVQQPVQQKNKRNVLVLDDVSRCAALLRRVALLFTAPAGLHPSSASLWPSPSTLPSR